MEQTGKLHRRQDAQERVALKEELNKRQNTWDSAIDAMQCLINASDN